MNSLSWFLYAADVISNVSFVFVFAAVACVIFCVGALILQMLTEGDMSKECPKVWKYWWRCAAGAFVLGMVAAFFPSKNTMYAIAASQAGERIASSEAVSGIAGDATKALHQWIKKQIEPEKKG